MQKLCMKSYYQIWWWICSPGEVLYFSSANRLNWKWIKGWDWTVVVAGSDIRCLQSRQTHKWLLYFSCIYFLICCPHKKQSFNLRVLSYCSYTYSSQKGFHKMFSNVCGPLWFISFVYASEIIKLIENSKGEAEYI